MTELRQVTTQPSSSSKPYDVRSGLLVAIVAMLVYANSLPNEFAYDDVAVVRDNPIVTSAGEWWTAWTNPYWPELKQDSREVVAYRPLTIQTFRWQFQLSGMVALPYHLTNVLLHALVSVGVWWLARKLNASAGAALFAGLVFAVHPIHTEAVANIVGRGELLAAGFTLLATCMALKAVRRETRGRRGLLWCAAWLAAGAALLSKESGVAGMVAVACIAFLRPDSESDGRSTLRAMLVGVLPALVIFGAYLFLRYEVCGNRLAVTGQRVAVGNPLDAADTIARCLTPLALLGRYVLLSLSPHRLLCDYSTNVLPPVASVMNGMLWIGVAFIVGCALLAIRRSPRRRIWQFLIVGFFASYFLTSNSLLLIDAIFAERFWYAPSMWLCVALALGLTGTLTLFAQRRRAVVGLGLCVLLALAARTVFRNPDWHDSRTLFARDLAAMRAPHRSARICAFRGEHLLAAGRAAESAELLREAISIYPDQARYHSALGRAYLAMGEPDAAVAALRDAVAIDPSVRETIALLEKAELLAAGRDPHSEYQAAKAAAIAEPMNVDTLRTWARLAETVEPDDAVNAYRQLTSLAPNDIEHWLGLALAQYQIGKATEAAQVYREVLQRWPDSWNAHTNLALLLMDQTNRALHDSVSALKHATRAVEIAPSNWQVRVNLAEVTARCGDRHQAAAMFQALADQSPADSTAKRLYAERARHLRGN